MASGLNDSKLLDIKIPVLHKNYKVTVLMILVDRCDCPKSNIRPTKEYSVCITCGIVIDKIYDNNLPIEQVVHFSNIMLGEVHPTINQTLSMLSNKIDMTFETRMGIIERSYQLVGSSVNYVDATKYAFSEVFPEIDLELKQKIIKKIEHTSQTKNECTYDCSDKCSKSHFNKHIFNKMKKLHLIVENGIKNNRNIDDILKSANFSKTKYYKYRDEKYTHIKKLTKDKVRTPEDKRIRIITPEISDYIMDEKNKTQTLRTIQINIAMEFKSNIHITTIHYHRKKMNEAI